MCLTLFAWKAHPEFALVVANNRDEVYTRAAEPLHWWSDSAVLAGVDVPSGGTWMGVAADGRFAVVSNVREGRPSAGAAAEVSRGWLPTGFLQTGLSPEEYATRTQAAGGDYRGFSLLCGDLREMWWVSNRSRRSPRRVDPGVHGASNAPAIDPGWPKVVGGRVAFAAAVEGDDGSPEAGAAYFDLLHDTTFAPRKRLPHTGVGLVTEKLLSARFVRMGVYGTRASTVLRMRYDRSFDMVERRFGRWRRIGETRFTTTSARASGPDSSPDLPWV